MFLIASFQLEIPKDGVYVHGLFMDGFQWDNMNMMVTDAKSGEMNSVLPIMHMEPEIELQRNDKIYCCPLYKTALRAGTLSTTGTTIIID